MKNQITYAYGFKWGLALIAICFAFTIQAQTSNFVFTLSGANEVPSNASAGSGSGTLTLNTATNAYTITGNVSGLMGNTTAAHIHAAPAGSNGGVVVPLTLTPLGTTTSAISGSGILTSAQVLTLNTSELYVNIHTTAVPSGEVRGQITPSLVMATAPIPTMSQWGLLIFGLLIMNLSVFFVQLRELI